MMAELRRTVAIAGGGLAGLAAGCALAGAGYEVQLFERRPYLGGRASSYQHPGTGEVVDNCQHVLLGCCTNLLDLYQRSGVVDQVRWFTDLVFIEPGGRRSIIGPSFFPEPLHTSPSFLKARALSITDKVAVARAMFSLLRDVPDDGKPFLDWLRSHGQTQRAIDRFWNVVLVSALNEDLDRVSTKYAALVFRESFLKSRHAGRMGIPSVPLTDLYSAAGRYIEQHGGKIALRAPVETFRADRAGVKLCVGSSEIRTDFLVLALPFNTLAQILPDEPAAAALRGMLGQFESSPITGIHLWFDRKVTDLDHAVLLDRTMQWMFNKSRLQERKDEGSYLELVVSASKSLVEKSRQEILDLALRELAEFLPEVANARLTKGTVIKEVHATYSPKPGVDSYRPGASSAWERVFLAGDWTMTGWPATMEGAVRAGYLAAEAIAGKKFMVADLPPRGLMRLFP